MQADCGSLLFDLIPWGGILVVSIISLFAGVLFAYLLFRSRLTKARRQLLDAESRIALDASVQRRLEEGLHEALNTLGALQKTTDGALRRAREQLEELLAQLRFDLRGNVDARRFAASLDMDLRELRHHAGRLEKEQVVIPGLQEYVHAMGQIHERLQTLLSRGESDREDL